MICALLIGREGSTGFPGKNVLPILGRPLMVYPLLAARACRKVDRIYVSTDAEKISYPTRLQTEEKRRCTAPEWAGRA